MDALRTPTVRSIRCARYSLSLLLLTVPQNSDQCRICGNFYRYGKLEGSICDSCVQLAGMHHSFP